MTKPIALIVGVGEALSASLARLLYKKGYALVLSARNGAKLQELAAETDAKVVECDGSDPQGCSTLIT